MTTTASFSNANRSAKSEASPASAKTNDTSTTAFTFQTADLQILNWLDQPVWVFDVVRRSMFWANHKALELWDADSLESLLQRSFKDMSEATTMRLDAYMERFLQDETGKEQWTFYPKGQAAVVVDCVFKGILVEEGRMCMLVQGAVEYGGTTKTKTTELGEEKKEALRATEMIRHLPVSVCLTDLHGNILQQNPESMAVFGKENHLGVSNILNRFVDRALGYQILEKARLQPDDQNQDISVQAIQNTVHGSQWSSIKIRKTRDPVTSEQVLLCVTSDCSRIIETHRQASLQEVSKFDFLVNMAHQMRASLHHVLGVVERLSKLHMENAMEAKGISGTMGREDDYEKTKSPPTATSRDGSADDCFSLLLASATLLMSIIENFTDAGSPKINAHLVEAIPYQTPPHLTNNQDQLPLQSENGMEVSSFGHATKLCFQLDHRPLDIRSVVEGAIQSIQAQATAKDLNIRVMIYSRSIETGTAELLGDASRLQQALLEILHNAVKYTSTKGMIFVSVRQTASKSFRQYKVRFEIKDTGIGMNLEEQKQCLSNYLEGYNENHNDQVAYDCIRGTDDIMSTSQQKHQGQGLKRCQAIVQAMGGAIGIKSKPSQGSMFWMEIPFLRTGGSSKCASLRKRSSSRRGGSRSSQCGAMALSRPLETVVDRDDGGLNILLVDDQDASGRNVLKALLEESGHTVDTVATGDAMVESVVDRDYDVVLLETSLNDGNTKTEETRDRQHLSALDATRHVRDLLGYSPETLPIVALTTSVPRSDYADLGLNDWLTKPILVKDIQKAITNAICNIGRNKSGGSLGSCTTYDDSTIGSLPSMCDTVIGNTTTTNNKSQYYTPAPLSFQCSSVYIGIPETKQCVDTTTASGGIDSIPIMPRRSSLSSSKTNLSERMVQAKALEID